VAGFPHYLPRLRLDLFEFLSAVLLPQDLLPQLVKIPADRLAHVR
jgi:hypothetical protein